MKLLCALFLLATGFMAGTIYSTGYPYKRCKQLAVTFDDALKFYQEGK